MTKLNQLFVPSKHNSHPRQRLHIRYGVPVNYLKKKKNSLFIAENFVRFFILLWRNKQLTRIFIPFPIEAFNSFGNGPVGGVYADRPHSADSQPFEFCFSDTSIVIPCCCESENELIRNEQMIMLKLGASKHFISLLKLLRLFVNE